MGYFKKVFIDKVTFLLIIIGYFYEIKAQQSFFNIPNSHITEKNEFFFQQQSNFSKNIYQFNQTLCFGLGSGFEIGVNQFGISLAPSHQSLRLVSNFEISSPALYPFYMLNAQKAFHLNKHMEIASGFQFGGNVSDLNHFNSGIYAFTNYALKIDASKTWFAGGVYYANENYFGKGDRLILNSPIGIQFGIEQFFIKHKLAIVLDYFSGLHDFGEGTIGLSYEATSHLNFSLGYQIPNMNSTSPQSIVFEITLNRLTKRKAFVKKIME
ncbi:MAG: hypothetical protein SFY32_07855 [Bacteroidota bacterium]|nr:hypothetical protein [Bacteroidota bacterium]